LQIKTAYEIETERENPVKMSLADLNPTKSVKRPPNTGDNI
jgi:hypothetical protein